MCELLSANVKRSFSFLLLLIIVNKNTNKNKKSYVVMSTGNHKALHPEGFQKKPELWRLRQCEE